MLSIQTLGFEWPNGQVVFQNLSFKIDRQKWAVIAANGGGKSTLLRVLAKELDATEGQLTGNAKVIYLPQDPDREIGQSGGEWMMQRLEEALMQDPAVLLLDEPTNHLDEKHQALFRRRILNLDCAVIMASHDRELLKACDGVWVFEGTQLRFFAGGFEDYEQQLELEKRAKEDRLHLAKQNLKSVKNESQRAVDTQDKRNRQGQKDGEKGGMPKILLGARKRAAETTTGKVRSKTSSWIDDAADEFKEAVQSRVVDTKPYFEWDIADRLKHRAQVALRDVQLHFNEQSFWSEPLNLNLWTGQRLWIRGLNGSGKSTLVNQLAGKAPPAGFRFTGELQKAPGRFEWVQQMPTSPDDLTQSLFEVLRPQTRITDQELLNQLARFQFPIQKARQAFQTLSGGEKVRAGYARIFLGDQKPELLLLDEPSNHLDLQTKDWLVEVLALYPGCVVLISHDKDFAQRLKPTSELLLSKMK